MKCSEKRNSLVVFAGVALLSAGMAFAQSPGGGGGGGGMQQQQSQPGAGAGGNGMGNNQTQAPGNGMMDNDFVHSALQGGMGEVQLGQLASQKGSSDDVKQFGQQMVADHTKMNEAMTQVATQMGVKPPKEVSKNDKKLMEKLQGMSGDDFDKAYIAAMIKDHKKDDQDFKMESGQTQNTALKQVADQGTQVIEHHLQMIEQIAKAHNLVDDKGKMTSGN